MVGVVGFEPTQSETTDLQSAPALQLRRTPLLVRSVELRMRSYIT